MRSSRSAKYCNLPIRRTVFVRRRCVRRTSAAARIRPDEMLMSQIERVGEANMQV